MPGRRTILVTLAIQIVCASLFVRLGFWQLSRLSERRAFNSKVVERLRETPQPLATLSPDTSLGHYRQLSVSGTFDFDREVFLAGRSHNGSPGVNLLTPLRTGAGDSAVLVNRGWVYSADAASLDDASRWREPSGASISGYAETYVGADSRPQGGAGRRVRSLDRAAIERAVGLPLAAYILVQTSGATLRPDSVPVRLKLPVLDDGPHKNYALQWFAFAIITVVGGVALMLRSR